MERHEPRAGQLVRAEQIVKVCARVAGAASRARTALEDRLLRAAPARLDQIQTPARTRVGHQRDAMAPEPRRHRAIERVDPELDARDQVVDLADPQQVPGTVGREPLEGRWGPRDDLVYLLLVAAQRPADRDPVTRARGDRLS